jgi:group I intron endonuclease
MMICRALFKHGYSNFSLTILEYCEPDKCLERENLYLNLLKPEYNILLTAGSRLGYKYSDESRKKMSDSKIGLQAGENNPFSGKNHTDEIKAKMSDLKKGFLNPMYGKGIAVVVRNIETNENREYTTVREAARALKVTPQALSKRFKKKVPLYSKDSIR